MDGLSIIFTDIPSLVSASALGPLGCWESWMSAPAGEGAHPAVPSLPVPASAWELQTALWVWQPAGRPQLRPQHGDLCWMQEQLGKLLFMDFVIVKFLHLKKTRVKKQLKRNTAERFPLVYSYLQHSCWSVLFSLFGLRELWQLTLSDFISTFLILKFKIWMFWSCVLI